MFSAQFDYLLPLNCLKQEPVSLLHKPAARPLRRFMFSKTAASQHCLWFEVHHQPIISNPREITTKTRNTDIKWWLCNTCTLMGNRQKPEESNASLAIFHNSLASVFIYCRYKFTVALVITLQIQWLKKIFIHHWPNSEQVHFILELYALFL
jgi:hypothetical protein